jgi:DNA transformation protein
MAVRASFLAALTDVLDFVPDLKLKPMFGGTGIYSGDAFFAVAMDEVLYLKTDAQTQAAFDVRGLGPFVYRPRADGGRGMPYRQAPEELWEDPDTAREWVELAIGAARRKKR